MSTQFEFRLIGADAPDGQLDADQLVAIVQGLKDTTMRLGRVETDAAANGRPNKTLERVAKLRVGMDKGSTRLVFERSVDHEALDFDLDDEAAVDEQFEQLVESIARDERPEWVTDSQASAVADLVAALKRAAPEVEFSAAGQVRTSFKTARAHRETWSRPVEPPPSDAVTLTGRLEKVDLKSHDLRVRDDVGNAFALPKVEQDLAAGRLLGSYVTVAGQPEYDKRGRLLGVRDAKIALAPDPLGGSAIPEAIEIEAILASASGLEPGGLRGISDSEAEAFFRAMGM